MCEVGTVGKIADYQPQDLELNPRPGGLKRTQVIVDESRLILSVSNYHVPPSLNQIINYVYYVQRSIKFLCTNISQIQLQRRLFLSTKFITIKHHPIIQLQGAISDHENYNVLFEIYCAKTSYHPITIAKNSFCAKYM